MADDPEKIEIEIAIEEALKQLETLRDAGIRSIGEMRNAIAQQGVELLPSDTDEKLKGVLDTVTKIINQVDALKLSGASKESIISALGAAGPDLKKQIESSLKNLTVTAPVEAGGLHAAGGEEAAKAAEKVKEGHEKAKHAAEESEGAIARAGVTGAKSLTGLAEAAEKSAEALKNLSVKDLIEAFNALNHAVAETVEAFGTLGEHLATVATYVAGAVAAVAGTTYALYEFAESGSEATNKLGELARAAGTSTDEMLGLQGAFAASGAKTENFAQALKNLANRVQADWPEVMKMLRDSGQQMEEAQIRVQQASVAAASSQDLVQSAALGAEESQLRLKQANESLADSYTRSINSILDYKNAQNGVTNAAMGIQSAEMSLARARENLRIQQGGKKDENFEREFRQKEAVAAVAQAEQRVKEAYERSQKAALDLATARQTLANASRAEQLQKIEAERAQLAYNNALNEQETAASRARQQVLALATAEKAYTDAIQSNVAAVADKIGHTGDAFTDLGDKVDLSKVSTDNLFKAIELNAGAAANAGKELKDGWVTPTSMQLLEELSKTLAGITDQTKRAAVARQALGRFVDQAQLDALSKGSAAWKKFIDDGINTGFVISGPVKKAASDFEEAANTIAHNMEILRQQMSAPFQEIFAKGMEELNEYIVHNREKIVEWAQVIATRVKPVILDFFNIVTGRPVETPWIKALIAGLNDLYTLLKAVGAFLIEFGTQVDDVVKHTIGWKLAIEILIGLKLGGWIMEMVGPLTQALPLLRNLGAIGLGAWATTAAGSVAALAIGLGELALAMGAVYLAYKLYKAHDDAANNTSEGTADQIEREKRRIAATETNRAAMAKSRTEPAKKEAILADYDKELAERKAHLADLITKNNVQLANEEPLKKAKEASAKTKKELSDLQAEFGTLDSERKTRENMIPAIPGAERRAEAVQKLDEVKKKIEELAPKIVEKEKESSDRDADVTVAARKYNETQKAIQAADGDQNKLNALIERIMNPPAHKDESGEHGGAAGAAGGEHGHGIPEPTHVVVDANSAAEEKARAIAAINEKAAILGKDNAEKIAKALGGGKDKPTASADFAGVMGANVSGDGYRSVQPAGSSAKYIHMDPGQKASGNYASSNGSMVGRSSEAANGYSSTIYTGNSATRYQVPEWSTPPDPVYDPQAATYEFYSKGGLVEGPGTTTSDSVDVSLSRKEYVVNADAVDHYGVDTMDKINRKQLASGGLVGDAIAHVINSFGSSTGGVGYAGGLLEGGLGAAVTRMATQGMTHMFGGGKNLMGPLGPGLFGGGGARGHFSMDLKTDGGNFSVLVNDQTLQTMQRSAIADKISSTGTQPSWVK